MHCVYLDDIILWTRDMKDCRWHRNCHCTIEFKDKLYILGGYGGEGIYTELLTYHICTFTFSNLPIDERKWNKRIVSNVDHYHTIARYAQKSIIVGKDVYVFGGYGQSKNWMNDISLMTLNNNNTVILHIKLYTCIFVLKLDYNILCFVGK
jgi:hypothetical protein